MSQISLDVVCPQCELVMAGRTRHCEICGKCIERYDHHCPWINNCVGIKNHNIFYALIINLFIYLLIGIIMCGIGLFGIFQDDDYSCEKVKLPQLFCKGKFFGVKVTTNETTIMIFTIVEGVVVAGLLVFQIMASLLVT